MSLTVSEKSQRITFIVYLIEQNVDVSDDIDQG